MNNGRDITVRNSLHGLECPVGYLAPDGRWFLLDSQDNGLAHLYLSDLVMEEYDDYIRENRIFIFHPDLELEHAGFIKVHGSTVRYFAHSVFSGYHDQGWQYTPDPTEVQIQRLCEYADLFGERGVLTFNSCRNRYASYHLRQMDSLSIRKLFER